MKNSQSDDQGVFLAVGVFALIFFGIPALYAAKSAAVNGFLLTLCKAQLKPFLLFSDEARQAMSMISTLEPGNLSWDKMTKILNYTGKWIRWPLAGFLFLLGGLSLSLGRVGALNRKFSMETLLKNNAEMIPCLIPVVGRGDYLLSRESYDNGPWMLARSPLQFAATHQLLTDTSGRPWSVDDLMRDGLGYTDLPAYGQSVFDRKRAEFILVAQLGSHRREFSEMQPERRALAAALAAFASGAKDAGIAALDQVSKTYRESPNPSCMALTDRQVMQSMDELFAKHSKITDRLNLIHAFELTWFMGLLGLARKKGVLASSQFLWVRPVDRSLWYALNQCGGRVAWIEGAAAWSHYQAETQACKAIVEPCIYKAVISLEDEFVRQGWLVSPEIHPQIDLSEEQI